MKTFFKPESAREEGTLPNFKALLHRRNVNGQVKATNGFEAHKDFVITVTRYKNAFCFDQLLNKLVSESAFFFDHFIKIFR